MKQSEIVLKELKRKKKGITPKDMLRFGIMRLGGIVYKLRRNGHYIVTKMETVKTRYGVSNYARYILR